MTERTLLLIKPDGVERRLVGEIVSRIERKGLTFAALEMRIVSEELAPASASAACVPPAQQSA